MIKDNRKKIFVYFILFLWISVPVVDLLGEEFLDITFFSFREWEPMTAGRFAGPFKSSARFEKTIYGDLANMLKVRKYCQYRHQIFSTDSYGFRNFQNSDETNFPVVVLGDSDMAGSSLSDDQTFGYQLEKQLGVKVYNYAPQSPLFFLADERFRKSPPKIVIWEGIERTIIGGNYINYSACPEKKKIQIETSPPVRESDIQIPMLSKHFSQQFFSEIRWYLTGIKPESVGYIDQRSKMLFYSQGIELLRYNSVQRDIKTVLKGIEKVKKLCEERNIILIYLPLPDKENIYHDLLPSHYNEKRERSVFLQDLHAGLNDLNIYNVDLYSHFNKVSKDKFVYFLDDTHWNPDGVMEAVNITAKLIKNHDLLSPVLQ